ncbi:MAG: hypothetical protein C7B46_19230 [Sulfobacillus benefaciens]|uniref:Uncharacterized protein n=1 Tax=Sulfobacillus benefaciens TaxID=453960 RepID=A0A2T2X058_9FIRM|nr:MAG: hypothetical protein C7B46_19230 [Sulfobacillus benefaciens]
MPHVKTVSRLGLRYRNRLDLPLPIRDFKDYLRTVPEISPDMPQELSGMFMRVQVPFEADETQLFLTEAMIQPDRPEVISLVLEYEALREMCRYAKNLYNVGLYSVTIEDHNDWWPQSLVDSRTTLRSLVGMRPWRSGNQKQWDDKAAIFCPMPSRDAVKI